MLAQSQTVLSFHVPRLNAHAAATAYVQNAIVTATKIPRGPKPIQIPIT
jgi:hypothetical protein